MKPRKTPMRTVRIGDDLWDVPAMRDEIERLLTVLDEAYREDVGLTTWHQHPELQLRERHEAWLDEEERAGR